MNDQVASPVVSGGNDAFKALLRTVSNDIPSPRLTARNFSNLIICRGVTDHNWSVWILPQGLAD